ncbi:MAG: LysM peptidoglycan-binding domain-containing protein [Eubacterium sp.]
MYPCRPGMHPYKVQAGDSLWRIAKRFNTTIQVIMDANPGISVYNMRIGQVICIPQAQNEQECICDGIIKEETALGNRLRQLWEQHVYWTRMTIFSIINDLPDTEQVTNRLLRNAKDFENVLAPIYGEDIAAKFAELLTEHLTIAGELVNAAKAGNSTAVNDAEQRWYSNANEIAAFLSSINPYWSQQEWQEMLYDHLAMTKQEAIDFLNKDYDASIAIFEEIEQEAMEMADMMTTGIIKQLYHNS